MREKKIGGLAPANQSWLPVQGIHAETLRLVDLLSIPHSSRLSPTALVGPATAELAASSGHAPSAPKHLNEQ